jgi:hypothetical protein
VKGDRPMSKSNLIGVRIDDTLNNQIEAFANANQLSKVDAIRQLLSSKCNDLTTDLMQVKTATNITAMEATETRKHVAKMTEVLAMKLPAVDKSIEAIATRLTTMEKNNEIIADLLVKTYKKITEKG